MTPQSVGEELRELRNFRGLSLKDMHKRTGIYPGTISAIETGKRQASVNMLIRLCEALEAEVVIRRKEDYD